MAMKESIKQISYHAGVKYEEWISTTVISCYHRTNGPAYTEWDTNGNIIKQDWLVQNNYHRTDGPAYINWVQDYHEWWINGVNKTTAINEWLEKNNIKLTKKKTLKPRDKMLFKLVWLY